MYWQTHTHTHPSLRVHRCIHTYKRFSFLALVLDADCPTSPILTVQLIANLIWPLIFYKGKSMVGAVADSAGGWGVVFKIYGDTSPFTAIKE